MSAALQDNSAQHFLRSRLSPPWNRHKRESQPKPKPKRERKIWSPPWRKKKLSKCSLETVEAPTLVVEDEESLSMVYSPPETTTATTRTTTTPNLKSCLKVRTLAESLDSQHGSRRLFIPKVRGLEFEEETDENSQLRSNLTVDTETTPPKATTVDSHNNDEKETQQETKGIRFSTIEIREYPIRVGDSPSLTGGPPLTIDWSYTTTTKINVDDYERENPSHQRLMEDDLMIPSQERFEWLLQAGHTQDELYEATRLAEMLARQRTGMYYGFLY